MTTARENHSATLLGDGRVLLAGGYDFHDGAGSVQSSAEIYDPKTNSFAPTGSMGSPREGQTATRLRDGLVLIAGGADSTTSAVATAELYDPKTGSFSPTNPMSTPRYLATATLLANGKVLVTGGLDGPTLTDRSLDSAELYDPATGAFELTRSMSTARASQTATLLPDGRVAIIGGRGDVAPVPWAELYNPKTGIFTISGSMTLPRFGQAASLLPDGRILVAGGSRTVGGGSATYLAAAEVFDPRTGVFSPTGWLSTPRFAPTTTLVSNGRVLVIGGWVDAGTTSRIAATLESYDPATGTFTPVTPPGSAQAGSGFAIALGTASGTSN